MELYNQLDPVLNNSNKQNCFQARYIAGYVAAVSFFISSCMFLQNYLKGCEKLKMFAISVKRTKQLGEIMPHLSEHYLVITLSLKVVGQYWYLQK